MEEGKITRSVRLTLAGGVVGYVGVFLAAVLIACILFFDDDKARGGLLNAGVFLFGPIGGVAGLFVGALVARVRRRQPD